MMQTFYMLILFLINQNLEGIIMDKKLSDQSSNTSIQQSIKVPRAEWEDKMIADLRKNYFPLKNSILIDDKNIEKIEIFLINSTISSQIPFDAERVREHTLSVVNDPTHPNYGTKLAVHYQLSKENFPKIVELIHSIHATSFDKSKYENQSLYDYRLLIEIQYTDKNIIQIITAEVSSGNILWGKVVKNQQSYYLIMDNQDMDKLMYYIDPEMTTWHFARPYI